jgi:hypothetical protein
MDEIRAMEDRLRAAMLASDVAELDALIDDRLRFVLPNGAVATKADDLAAHRSGAQRFTRLEVRELEIVVLGPDTAVAVARAEMAGSAGPMAFEGSFRYLRTWVRTEHGWRIAAGSVCPGS